MNSVVISPESDDESKKLNWVAVDSGEFED